MQATRIRAGRSLVICAALLSCGALTTACSPSKRNSAPVPPPVLQLWGDLKPIVSVKELMRDMIDPASDYIFDAVGIVNSRTGDVETKPKTDADWDKIRIGAVTLAEGVYLLKIPRPF